MKYILKLLLYAAAHRDWDIFYVGNTGDYHNNFDQRILPDIICSPHC